MPKAKLPMDNPVPGNRPRFRDLFAVFALISSVTIGGGYAMIPVICRAITKRNWMTEDRFYEILTEAQSFPGPIALNISVLCGRELSGFQGALAGFFGILLPPFFVIVAVGASFATLSRYPAFLAFLDGAAWTVPGLVAGMLLKISTKTKWTAPKVVLAMATAIPMFLFPSWTIVIFFSSAVIGFPWRDAWNS